MAASHRIEIELLQAAGHRADLAIAHRTVVDLEHRGEVGSSAGKETLLGYVKLIAPY